MALDKRMTTLEVVQQLRSGMTIGIGGWGPRRKPMGLVREIIRSDLTDLTIVAYGGADVGMLCAAGKVKKLIYAFVSLDVIPTEPYFRQARESGRLQIVELDEGLLQWGLRAAAMRMPFLPSRVGIATDILDKNPDFKLIQSPYADGELFLAMPAIPLDVSLLHVNVADQWGNTRIFSPDPFFDDLFARAAQRTYVTAEKVVPLLLDGADAAKFNYYERNLVKGVVELPGGAHPSSCGPDYGWDLPHLKQYTDSAAQDNGWLKYQQDFIKNSEDDYLSTVGGSAAIRAIPYSPF